MENLPFYISSVFLIATALTAFLFFKSAHYSKSVMIIVCIWMILQGIIGLSGFYTVTTGLPPRFMLMIAPPLLVIILLFVRTKGRSFIDNLDMKTLTLLHIVRIPVEFVLYWLAVQKAVPWLMTFEGRNFDILAGLSAPFIWYYGFIKKRLSRKVLIGWNIFCTVLLLNIVVNAILSAPFQFQQLAFYQPDIAVLYFPYNWLPCFIVPVVLFSHMVSLRRLLKIVNSTEAFVTKEAGV